MNSLPHRVLDALAPLPAGYEALLQRVVDILGGDPRVRAIWLSGSLASGLADRASDLDVVVTVRDPHLQAFAEDFPDWCGRITASVLAETVIPGRVFTLITPDWLRFDIVLEEEADLDHALKSPRIACWDPDDLTERVLVQEDQPGPSQDTVRRLITEWFRVTGMPECITARNDWLLAMVHVSYLRDLLYRLFVEAGKPMPARGVKWWSGKLSRRQQEALRRLPVTALDPASLVSAHLAYSEVFLGTAEVLAARLRVPWPSALEDAARRHLQQEWRIGDPYPRGEVLLDA